MQYTLCSFHVCGPTIGKKLPQDRRSTDTREQFKRRLKGWLFECAYGRRRVCLIDVIIIIIIINKVLIKVMLNKVIAGALYIVICG